MDVSLRWEVFLNLFIGEENIFKPEVLKFENEVKTIKYIYGEGVIRDSFEHWLEAQEDIEEDVQQSEICRQKGNDLLKNPKTFMESLQSYTEAIFSAVTKESACLAHANRAYVLMKIKNYKAAYYDCESAVLLGYPKSKLVKILARQAECALELHDMEKIKDTLKFLEDLKDQSLESVIKRLQQELKTLEKKGADILDNKPKRNDVKQVLRSKSKVGTYVIAGQSITKNDEIMTEKAYSYVPLFGHAEDDEINFNCQNCAEVDIIPFPCYCCHRVSYCSPNCKKNHADIHQYECSGYRILLFHNIGISYLALRTLLVSIDDIIGQLKNSSGGLNETPENIWKILSEVYKESCSPYSQVFRLVSNIEKMNSKDFILYALTASMLTSYLKNFTNFFDDKFGQIVKNTENLEIVIGALIMRHTAQLISNAHSIYGFTLYKTKKYSSWECFENLKLGNLHNYSKSELFSALYPRVSLYNHSCEPNFRNVFHDNILTVKATKNIKQNDEIFNCYGIHYKQMDAISRREILFAQHFFKCNCKHCTGDDSEFKKYHTYICTRNNCQAEFTYFNSECNWWMDLDNEFSFECTVCKQPWDWEWYKHFWALLSSPDSEETCEKLCVIFRLSTKYLHKSSKMRQDMGSQILKKFSDCPFNPSICKRLIDTSEDLLLAVEDQYGCYSPEFLCISLYYLDFIALQNVHNPKDLLVINYDINKILNCFEILPEKTRKIFIAYVNKYIKKL